VRSPDQQPTSKGREERGERRGEGEGLLLKGTEGREGEERDGNGGEENFVQSQGE